MERTQNLELSMTDGASDRMDGQDLRWLLDLVQDLDAIVWEADAATLRSTFVSGRAVDVLGYTVDRWLSEADFWINLVHPEDRERTVSIRRALTDEGRDHTFEYRAIRADGSIVWLRDIVRVSRDVAGRPARLRGVMVDITEAKRAEETLRGAEERYRSIFENSVEGIFQTTRDGRYLAANPSLARMLGYDSPEELMAGVADVSTLYVEPGGREEFAREVGEHGAISGYDYQVYRKDGSTIWVSEKVRALRDPDGDVVGYEGTTLDITERRRTEQEVRDSEARYRLQFESNPHPMWVFDVETLVFVAVNDAAIESYGYPRDEFFAMTIKDIRPPEDVPTLIDHLANTYRYDHERIWRHRKKDGTVIDVEIASHDVTFEGKQARLVMANDVTKRVLAERQLREAEARYRALVEQMPAVTYIDRIDPAAPRQGEALYMSPQVEAMLGYTPGGAHRRPRALGRAPAPRRSRSRAGRGRRPLRDRRAPRPRVPDGRTGRACGLGP